MNKRPYLVVYDWACGQLMSAVEFASVDAAEAQRDKVAAGYEDDESIEVSVRFAESPPSDADFRRSGTA